MQIVIDIPKEIVEWANKYCDYIKIFTDKNTGIIIDAVKNGTPLPKGHGRLIDADELDVGAVFDDYGNRQGYKYVGEYELNNAPTIIEADAERMAMMNGKK